MTEFPKWKYHKTEKALIVHSKEDEAGLGQGWVNHPDHIEFETEAKKPRAARVAKVKADGVQST